MIRIANKFDLPQVKDLLRQFADESPFDWCHNYDDMDYIDVMLFNIMAGQGAIFLADGKGFLMSMVMPNIWTSKVLMLHELAWYVKPEHRGGTTGHRLLKAYIEYGKEQKAAGRVQAFSLSKMPSSPKMKYDKYGFRQFDENWFQ
jgi:N-acetylglutamate synthase-like GNAT family acetyltransferase